MAARDDTYRNQRWLDIAFALSSVALLASMIWMFADDYYREYRPVQQRGREVEVALLRRQAADLKEQNAGRLAEYREKIRNVLASDYPEASLPKDTNDDNFLDKAKALLPVLRNDRIKSLEESPITTSIGTLKLPDLKARLIALSDELSAEKAVRDSLVSQRDILQGEGADASAVRRREDDIKRKERELAELELKVEELKQKVRDREAEIAEARKPFAEAVGDLDRLSKEQDRLLRQANQKEIGLGAKIRDLPIIDAFNSPYKIRQDIPDGLLIDYNFKQVNRVDRCATCHMFIDRPGFDKQSLGGLKDAPANGGGKGLQVDLTPSEVALYCNHPRLDLFLGSNSPHPVEKFGCTICHAGHGGSATFNFAYHFPDTGKTDGVNEELYVDKRKRWEGPKSKDGHNWHPDLHPDYLWEHKMLPGRFIESSCLKCHHQVTDLIRTDGKEEAPKLLKGYRLIRDLGCFGCHEMSGFKSGRSIGPDLRLEPHPPLSELSAVERAKLKADPNDPPGAMRKVGPGLRRIVEKTDPNWTSRWIRNPRAFRPDTKMPHFFGLTNNHPGALSDSQGNEASQVGEAQRGFPDAEIQAMTFYLFKGSDSYLARLGSVLKLSAAERAAEKQVRAAFQRLDEGRRENPALTPRTNDPLLPPDMPVEKLVGVGPEARPKLSKDQLAAVLAFFAERERQARAAELLHQRPYPPPELKDYKPNVQNGGNAFQKKSCVACHYSEKVKYYGPDGSLLSDAEFGPSLTGLREKLGSDKDKAAKWLYYWLSNPADYHPRTAMPTPQLTPHERADIIAWLLSDEGNVNPPAGWKDVTVGPGDLEKLARTYVEKALPKSMADAVLTSGLSMKDVQYLGLRTDADERLLINDAPGSPQATWSQEDRLKFYVGRKSIGRYGCYACHDIPGFENAKPIGTALNDWGKKDTERLAFENIIDYVTRHHQVPGHKHANGGEDVTGHPEYDPFFLHALEAHRRDGFLHQKLKAPRSYDYGKLKDRAWDDRLKMPEFKFARPRKKQAETDEEFAARAAREEHEGVEAVMTFILGLVAEPVPMKFVNQPRADRLYEVKGQKILERHNCIGCHVTKPGGYEFDLNALIRGETTMRQHLEGILSNVTNKEELARDPVFPEHNAWRTQRVSPPGRSVARGLIRSVEEDEVLGKQLSIDLWEALRFQDDKFQSSQIPAGFIVRVPVDPHLQQFAPTGGNFADVLQRVLAKLENKTLTGDRGYLMSSVPPPLVRQGQKVQPQWIYEFLRHPHGIRPAVQRNLQMPRFQLEHEEIEGLINYFIAVDRLWNPAIGVEHFPPKPAAQDPDVQDLLRAEFLQRVQQLMPPGKTASSADYFETGWRLLTDKNLCIKCHNIGQAPGFQVDGPTDPALQAQNLNGPNLNMVAERLRPEYVERYLSQPKRFLPYTLMPQYDPFFAPGPDYHAAQMGLRNPRDRSLLQFGPLLSPTAPAIPLTLDGRVYDQLELEFALRPDEKVRAVRDALMSWGFMPQPPPTGQKAGPRGDIHGRGAHKGGSHP